MESTSESERMHHHAEEMEDKKSNRPRAYWKRAHHDWRFWLVVILMLFAIFYYTVSDNFVLAPSNQPAQPSQNSRVP